MTAAITPPGLSMGKDIAAAALAVSRYTKEQTNDTYNQYFHGMIQLQMVEYNANMKLFAFFFQDSF
jgi:hypothetical protein